MTRRIVQLLLSWALVVAFHPSIARAEDTKGKWQFGFGLSYFATTDYIRSNSDLAFVSDLPAIGGLAAVGNVDERPDINILNQASITDDFKVDFSTSYGLTRWLALEAAGSYQKSSVGNIEYFSIDNTWQPLPSPTDSISACGPNLASPAPCGSYALTNPQPEKRTNVFVPVGQITKIPIQLSGLVRFRPESPFDPYIGLGVGYTLASLNESPHFAAAQKTVANLEVQHAWEGEYTNIHSQPQAKDPPVGSLTFTPGPLQATVRNSFEWHAVGGVDYYINDRFSFYVDARYTWTSGQVNITTDSAHQVLFAMLDDGQLLTRKQETDPSQPPGPNNTMYLWEDKLGVWNPNTGASLDCTVTLADGTTRSCTGDGFFETEDKNMNGVMDWGPEGKGPTEDDGVMRVYAPGPITTNERPGLEGGDYFSNITAFCPGCVGNEPYPNRPNVLMRPDTEDRNYNFYMDRFLLYGIDFCTTPESVGSPVCANATKQYTPGMPTRYVWPSGCVLVPSTQFGDTPAAEGCPPPPATSANVTSTGSDNAIDTTLIQGGRIRLGGFSLGVGLKFTF